MIWKPTTYICITYLSMHYIIFVGCSLKKEPEFIRSLHFFCKKAAAESPKKVSQILKASIRCVQFGVG